MSDASATSFKKGPGSRVTVRLSERELEALRELADERGTDLTGVIRNAIAAFLEHTHAQAAHQAEHQRMATALAAAVAREADRVIERQEHTTRALIAALNERFAP